MSSIIKRNQSESNFETWKAFKSSMSYDNNLSISLKKIVVVLRIRKTLNFEENKFLRNLKILNDNFNNKNKQHRIPNKVEWKHNVIPSFFKDNFLEELWAYYTYLWPKRILNWDNQKRRQDLAGRNFFLMKIGFWLSGEKLNKWSDLGSDEKNYFPTLDEKKGLET